LISPDSRDGFENKKCRLTEGSGGFVLRCVDNRLRVMSFSGFVFVKGYSQQDRQREAGQPKNYSENNAH
jgi:hypothetical protein